MPKKIYYFLSVATAICIATVHLTQPILQVLSTEFNISSGQASRIPTLTQLGYAFGLFFIVPLGDIFPKRRLILLKLSMLCVLLLMLGLIPNFYLFLVASFLIGVVATAAQDFVPLAAEMAPEKNRGQLVGLVMSGLMLGVVFSRMISGAIANRYGWQAVFYVSACVVFVLLLVVGGSIPKTQNSNPGTPTQIYRSMFALVGKFRQIRLIVFRHGLAAACFAAFWSSLSYLMSAPPFSLKPLEIGQISLAGIAGALLGSTIGGFTDRYGPKRSLILGSAMILGASFFMIFFHQALVLVLVYAIAIDLGFRVSLVTNQAVIYSFDPKMRSRLNGIMIGGQFAFFSISTFLSGYLWQISGWAGVSVLCVFASLGSLLISSIPTDAQTLTEGK